MSASGSSLARYKSWATRTLATSSLTSVPRRRMRSLRRREITSICPEPPSTVGRGGGERGRLGFSWGSLSGCVMCWIFDDCFVCYLWFV